MIQYYSSGNEKRVFAAFINTETRGRCTILQEITLWSFLLCGGAGNGPSERTPCARQKFWEKRVKETNAKCWIVARCRATKGRKLPTLRFAAKKIREARRFDNRGIVGAPYEIRPRTDKYLTNAALVLPRIYRSRVCARLKHREIYLELPG